MKLIPWSAASFAVIIAFLWQQQQVDAESFEWLVPGDLQHCCGDTLDPKCLEIDSISEYRDGHQYVFAKNSIIKIRIKPKGYPEVYHGATVNVSDWIPGAMPNDKERVIAAFYDGRHILVKRGSKFYKFKEPMKPAEDFATSDCEKSGHPLFCDNAPGKLVDVTVSAIRGNDDFDEIKAYYKHTAEDGSISYVVKNYIGDVPEEEVEPLPFASVSAATTYYEDRRVHGDSLADYGYVFEENGFACPFILKQGQSGVASYGGAKNPMISCFPTNVFLGCPQSFCFRGDVDDVMTTNVDVPGGSAVERLMVYRGHYHFETESRVPVVVPKARDQHLSMIGYGQNRKRHAYIDAAFEIGGLGGDSRFTAFIKDTDVYTYGDDVGEGSIVKIYDLFPRIWKPLVGEDTFGTIDAAFLAQNQQLLYVFIGGRYVIYSFEQTKGSTGTAIQFAFEEGDEIEARFPGLPSDIDGAVSINSMVYILKGNWVYKLRESELAVPGAMYKWEPELIFYSQETNQGFFQVDSLCQRTDEEWAVIRRDLAKPPRLQDEKEYLPQDKDDPYFGTAALVMLASILFAVCVLSCAKSSNPYGTSNTYAQFNNFRHPPSTMGDPNNASRSTYKGIKERMNMLRSKK